MINAINAETKCATRYTREKALIPIKTTPAESRTKLNSTAMKSAFIIDHVEAKRRAE